MSEPVQRQGGMVLRKKEKCYHFYHQRFKLKKKKKAVIINTGSEGLSSNLGRDWCECEQFLCLSILIYEMEILVTCMSPRTFVGAKLRVS